MQARDKVRQGQRKEAVTLFREALELQKEIMGENTPPQNKLLRELAAQHAALQEFAEAEKAYQKALEIGRVVFTEKHPTYADTLYNAAQFYMKRQQMAKALPLVGLRDLRKELHTDQHPLYAGALNCLAYVHHYSGKQELARDLNEQAQALYQKAGMSVSVDYRNVLRNLAVNYRELGDYRKAQVAAEEVHDLCRRLHGEDHIEYANSLRELGWIYLPLGEYTRALEIAEKACVITRKQLTENDLLYAHSLNLVAWAYKELGEYEKALERAEQARDHPKARGRGASQLRQPGLHLRSALRGPGQLPACPCPARGGAGSGSKGPR